MLRYNRINFSCVSFQSFIINWLILCDDRWYQDVCLLEKIYLSDFATGIEEKRSLMSLQSYFYYNILGGIFLFYLELSFIPQPLKENK